MMAVLVAVNGFRESNVSHELDFYPLVFNLKKGHQFIEGEVRPLGAPYITINDSTLISRLPGNIKSKPKS